MNCSREIARWVVMRPSWVAIRSVDWVKGVNENGGSGSVLPSFDEDVDEVEEENDDWPPK